MFTLAQRLDDENESKKCEKDNVEFLEAGEDAAEAFEPPEKPFDFIPLLVQRAVILRCDSPL